MAFNYLNKDGLQYFWNKIKAKIGTATLTTTAQDLSGAVNELKSDLSNKSTINLNNVYTGYSMVVILKSVTFTNGFAQIDLSNYKEANKTYSTIAFANAVSTNTIYISGCEIDANTNMCNLKTRSDYSGTISLNILAFTR